MKENFNFEKVLWKGKMYENEGLRNKKVLLVDTHKLTWPCNNAILR